jgi:hypothetical protein
MLLRENAIVFLGAWPKLSISDKDVAYFWDRVDNRHGINSCWHWLGSHYRNGYAQAYLGTHQIVAHRLALMLLIRRLIPDDIEVGHDCPGGDNKWCVNPRHMRLFTPEEHGADRRAKGQVCDGDKNGMRLHPERLSRGDNHWERLHPERIIRGDKHWTKRSPEKIRRGEQIGLSKLNPDKVIEIRRKKAEGRSKASLAREYGVTTGAIWSLVNRRTWKHVK